MEYLNFSCNVDVAWEYIIIQMNHIALPQILSNISVAMIYSILSISILLICFPCWLKVLHFIFGFEIYSNSRVYDRFEQPHKIREGM